MKPKNACAYCGDAPVNHWVQYITSTLDILLERLVPNSNPWPIRVLGRICGKLALYSGILRPSKELSSSASNRTQVIWKEAVRRGIPIEQVIVLGKHVDECRAWLPEQPGRRARWHYFQSIPLPPRLDRKPAAWVDDKRAFKKHFIREGLSIAYGASVCTLSGALRAFRQINGPVIVKPRSGSRARHTSVNIVTETDFVAAYKRARELCGFVMIEACIPGDTYRVTCVGGRVVGAMHFVKPHIVADGSSTSDELLARYNQSLPEGVAPVKRDGPYNDAIIRQGFTSEDMPPAGVTLVLAEHSERANGGYNEDVTDRLPENAREEIERAARLCGLAVIGFDIISRDLTNPSEPFTFIEGNSLPFIDIHHDPTYGTPQNVAGAVWDLWLNEV